MWEAEDPDSGLGTDLYFVADLDTPILIEPFPSSLADAFVLNRGAEIDVASANLPVNKVGEARRSGDPDSNAVTLTSGVPDYPAAVFSGADIRMGTSSWSSGAEAPWNVTDFQDVLAHEIGHALGFQHPDRLTGGRGSITSSAALFNTDPTSTPGVPHLPPEEVPDR